MTSHNHTSDSRLEAVSYQEFTALRRRVAELEGTVNETLLEFYQTVQHLQNLLYKLNQRSDGSYIFTMFEGKLSKELEIATDKIIGKTPEQLMPPEAAEIIVQNVRKAFAGEQVHFETHLGSRLLYHTVSPVIVNGAVIELVGSAIDITNLRHAENQRLQLAEQAEKELRRSNAILKATQETSIDGIFIVNEQRRIIEFNNRFMEIWQIPQEVMEQGDDQELVKRLLPKLMDADSFLQRLSDLYRYPLASGKGELRLKDERVLDWYSQAVLSPHGEPYGRIWYFRDITYRKKYEEQIKHQAYYDVLTDLPNRVLFQDRLSMSIAQAQRNNEMMAVLALNLDRFKLINATFGHAVGDLVLQAATRRLAAHLQEGDTLCRVGGDDFKIILPDVKQVQDAAKTAQKLLHELGKPLLIEGHELFIAASVGISIYPNDGADGTELERNANTAMYRAKENGMNTYQLYAPEMNATAFERLALENDLRKAIDRGELFVVYQPRINLQSNQLVAMEALVRWSHPRLGEVSPAQFIPIAEQTELISQIDTFVLRTACAQAKAWQDAGYPPLRVAVNISARQFQQKDLADTIAQILRETGLETRYLELEITESVAMSNADTALKTIHQLKSLGIQMAIDDFGTGYSSLSYLKKFPIETLKIDQSFVRDITVDPDDAAIVSYIISLGHSLHLNVIAEGVETEEQRCFLSEGNCDEMQGYLFSRPLTREKFEQLLQEYGGWPQL